MSVPYIDLTSEGSRKRHFTDDDDSDNDVGSDASDDAGRNSENAVSPEPVKVPTVTPRKKVGRPPKPKNDSAKNNSLKGSIRVALGVRQPKTKLRKVEAATVNNEASPFPLVQQTQTNSVKKSRGRPRIHPLKNEPSPFPLVQQTDSVKKSRGRPRIHPPKDTSVKRPRGRPRTIPLEGEQAWKNECGKLRRLVKKQNDIIEKLKQRLTTLGQSVDDIQEEEAETDSHAIEPINIVPIDEKSKDGNGSSEDATSLILEASNIEDTHQTYIGMFTNNENRAEEDDEDEDKDEDSGSGDSSSSLI